MRLALFALALFASGGDERLTFDADETRLDGLSLTFTCPGPTLSCDTFDMPVTLARNGAPVVELTSIERGRFCWRFVGGEEQCHTRPPWDTP